MDRTEKGTFTEKFIGEPKKLRSIRLTDTAWDKLEEIAENLSITRTDFIELIARQYQSEEKIALTLLDRFIEQESQRDRKGNQYGTDLKPKARTWDKFNQFKEWVKNEQTRINQRVERQSKSN